MAKPGGYNQVVSFSRQTPSSPAKLPHSPPNLSFSPHSPANQDLYVNPQPENASKASAYADDTQTLIHGGEHVTVKEMPQTASAVMKLQIKRPLWWFLMIMQVQLSATFVFFLSPPQGLTHQLVVFASLTITFQTVFTENLREKEWKWVSVDQSAFGFIAIGQISVGVIAIGQLAVGIISVSQGMCSTNHMAHTHTLHSSMIHD